MNNLERAYINEQMQAIHFRPADKTLDEAKAAVPEGIEAEYIAKTGDPGMLIEIRQTKSAQTWLLWAAAAWVPLRACSSAPYPITC